MLTVNYTLLLRYTMLASHYCGIFALLVYTYCVLISMCMLSRILWNILKELPFALYKDKTSAEHKRLSGKDYALKKRREVVHAWTDKSQWQQLITGTFWRTVCVQILYGILRLIAVAVLTIVFTFLYVYVRDTFW